ncbi:MAG: choice-of-anchor D domain-containing protein, partial [Acidobacteriaceae bacterium]
MLATCLAGGASGCGVTLGHPNSTNNNGNGGTSNGSGTLLVSSSTVSFGSVTVGQTASANVVLTNGGSASVQISEMQVSGKYFAVAGQGSLPITLAGGDTYNLNLQFDPAMAGAQTGTLSITSDASSGATAAISLTGTGVQAPGEPVSGVLSGLTCTSGTMTGAGTDACVVTLNAAAGSSGLTVNLTSSSSAVTVPGSVTVAAGATSAGFTATVMAVTTAQAATLTAAAGSVTET